MNLDRFLIILGKESIEAMGDQYEYEASKRDSFADLSLEPSYLPS